MFRFLRRNQVMTLARDERMQQLAAKIAELAAKDTKHKTFGALNGHRYRMNPVLPSGDVAEFEREYNVRLPKDYADFLTQIGNGGIGPYYGLYSLEQSVADYPGHTSREFLASPFPLTEFFNPFDEIENATDELLFDDRYICGSVVLSHQGCGHYDRLVITGQQAGQVWSDGRASDQGIVPLGCDFYTWYDRWVTESLHEL